MHGVVLRDEVPFTDKMVLLDADGPEIDVDGPQDLLQTLAALRAAGVVDHVRSHEVVQSRLVAQLLPPEQLVDDLFRASLAHDVNLHRRRSGALTTMGHQTDSFQIVRRAVNIQLTRTGTRRRRRPRP
jgi:hypothetical protein